MEEKKWRDLLLLLLMGTQCERLQSVVVSAKETSVVKTFCCWEEIGDGSWWSEGVDTGVCICTL